MYLKPRNKIHVKFINLDNHELKFTQNFVQLDIYENDCGKELSTKESWYKSNFILVGSNFISPYYNTQAEKMSGQLKF